MRGNKSDSYYIGYGLGSDINLDTGDVDDTDAETLEQVIGNLVISDLIDGFDEGVADNLGERVKPVDNPYLVGLLEAIGFLDNANVMDVSIFNKEYTKPPLPEKGEPINFEISFVTSYEFDYFFAYLSSGDKYRNVLFRVHDDYDKVIKLYT